jgi:hypothetical protein
LNLFEEIKRLKRERNAIILGHNYMDYAVQLVSDFTGDSYDLSLKAQKTDADVIVFTGVYFMAEQAKALNMDKVVLSQTQTLAVPSPTPFPPSCLGKLRRSLSVERTILNLLIRMRGIASATREMVDNARQANPRVRIAATWKTTPG